MSRPNPVAPTREPTTGPGRDGYTERHPAYAQISAARTSGNAYLYGSDFVHHHYVTLKIARSEMVHDLHDWYHSREDYIEVALSEAQWATFVSSLNVGAGSPCTLVFLQGKEIPDIPRPAPKQDTFVEELQKRFESARERLGAVRAMVEAGKGGKVAALAAIDKALQELTANAPYVAQVFGEHMEREVEKAKTEIHAYAVHAGVTTATPELLAPAPARVLPEEAT